MSFSVSSSAAWRPMFGIGAGAEALGQLGADLNLVRRGVELEGLQIGIGDDELDAIEARRRHSVHGVAAAAANADDLDARAGAAFLVEPQAQQRGGVRVGEGSFACQP